MSVEIAITTWNRVDSVCGTIESALAVEHPSLTIVVYDNASDDDTVATVRSRFGDQVQVEAWTENRGRHANMTRAFAQSKADYLIMVFDDEELCPGGLVALIAALAESPNAAFAFGRARLRNHDGTIVNESMLMTPDAFEPPREQPGESWIRSIFEGGDYTWICSVLFNLNRIRPAVVQERDAPCDDSGLLMRAALHGDVVYVPATVTTKTEGNNGESVREGLVIEEPNAAGHSLTVEGIIGFRRTLERFLLNEGRAAFDRSERGHMVAAVDRVAATLVSERVTYVRRRHGRQAAVREFREAWLWIRRPRARVRLLRSIWRDR